ncbi:hypothetical protein TorRG33x02_325210 [Trema orientale]|uniref:Uncharacterized protein n=1 Tax=Trema orientale TaxID=63057 RepID=A0A2P5BD98_TREOI|nr:hypothetical protein TorRG33x02_325210 [Trema orientale]
MQRCHTRIKVNYNEWSENSKTQRYDKLQKKFDELANWAVESDDNCATFWNLMNELQIKKDQQFKSSDHLSSLIGSPIENCYKTSEECNIVHSPMVVQRHGRPPKNRKVSKVEKLVSMKKKGKQKKIKTKEKKDKVTNTEGGIVDDMMDKRVEVTGIEEGVMDDMVRKGKDTSSFILTEAIMQEKMILKEQYTPAIAPYTLDPSQVTSFQQLPGAHFQYLESYNFIPKFWPSHMYNAQGPPSSQGLQLEGTSSQAVYFQDPSEYYYHATSR